MPPRAHTYIHTNDLALKIINNKELPEMSIVCSGLNALNPAAIRSIHFNDACIEPHIQAPLK